MTTSPYVQLLLRDFDTVKREHWNDSLEIERVLGNITAFLGGLGELYGARDELRKQAGELAGVPVKLPRRSSQTDFQRGYEAGLAAREDAA